jgi:hypothetical protein
MASFFVSDNFSHHNNFSALSVLSKGNNLAFLLISFFVKISFFHHFSIIFSFSFQFFQNLAVFHKTILFIVS